VASGDHEKIAEILAEDVEFRPPTYWATWTGRDPVAAVLGHVGQVFEGFHYLSPGDGSDTDWALEFHCKVGNLDAVGGGPHHLERGWAHQGLRSGDAALQNHWRA